MFKIHLFTLHVRISPTDLGTYSFGVIWLIDGRRTDSRVIREGSVFTFEVRNPKSIKRQYAI